MYQLARKALFLLPTETSHHLSLNAIALASRLGLLKHLAKPENRPVEVMGLTFPNPVGLAAGLDKNGDYFNALAELGFGFNIGKNFDTPVEKASDDYRHCMEKVYAHTDYIAVNISSPNTPGLRDLQHALQLDELLATLKQTQTRLADEQGRYVPVALKIAPDLDDEQITDMARQLIKHGIDGVIATNTTLSREPIKRSPLAGEQGGLSGWPVRERATEVIGKLAKALDGALPIIGVGGIASDADACDKMNAGASLVQVYTGFIYRGPGLITEAAGALAAL